MKKFLEKVKQNKKVLLIIGGIILGIALIATGIWYYISDGFYNTPDDYTPIGDVNAPVVESQAQGRNLQEEIKALNATYPDAKYWLLVPGTVIDTPVFQATDNDRYLRHDRDNKQTKWGEPFMDYRCIMDNMDNMSHFIIYDHNTETNDHFTPLLNYKDKNFFNDHKVIEMSSLNGNYKWEIFSVFVTDVNYFYLDTHFENADEYSNFLKDLKSKSMYNTETEITGNETILTLSTCDYTRKDGRFVVQAKLVKE